MGDRQEAIERSDAARSGDVTLGESVVDAVAAAAENDPLELPPLYTVLDPVLLDGLFRECPSGRVTFEYAGYDVVARADRTVEVRASPGSDG